MFRLVGNKQANTIFTCTMKMVQVNKVFTSTDKNRHANIFFSAEKKRTGKVRVHRNRHKLIGHHNAYLCTGWNRQLTTS